MSADRVAGHGRNAGSARPPGEAGPPLTGIRVLDLTDDRAELAGRLLADLGATVIKVESPGGSRSRRRGPFDERPEADGQSLYWAAVGLGKHSIVLDIEREDDRLRLEELVPASDILLESGAPGRMARLGLSPERLSALNPGLIYCSVSPFGQEGPRAHWPQTELTIEAAGGLVMLQGDRDRPPIGVGVPQAAFHAGAQAAADCIIALNERAHSGLGQRLDTSMQEGIIWTLLNATGFPPIHGQNPPYSCESRQQAPPEVEGVRLVGLSTVECEDGYLLVPLGAGRAAPVVSRVMDELREQGRLPEPLSTFGWHDGLPGLLEESRDQALLALAARTLKGYFRGQRKGEVHRWASEHDLMVAPVNTAADLRSSSQLAHRRFWTDVGGRTHPGPFARLSRTPLVMDRPAPGLGADQALLDQAPRARRPEPSSDGVEQVPKPSERTGLAFEGLRVADFSWIGVGPITAKALADHGATVIHVESATRPDILRLGQPAREGPPSLDRSQFFADYNSSKLGLSLNLATDQGRDIALRLIEWADVVVESFTPGTMSKLGLDPEQILERRPDLIWYSTCLLGQTGPYATFAGFGQQGSAIAGLHGITGWPGRPPSGTWGAYSDMITPHFGVAALAATILERRRSGEGQRIDISQVEAAMHFMEPQLLDYTCNEQLPGPRGNESEWACPHGLYPAAGTERWVAIACESDAEWLALCSIAPLERFGSLTTLGKRLEHREEIDRELARWTGREEPRALEARLAAAGVPAAVAQFPTDLYRDRQVAHRGFFVTLDHPVMGPTPYDGFITRFSARREMLRKAAPLLGENTPEILTDLLGLSEGEIIEAAGAGALT